MVILDNIDISNYYNKYVNKTHPTQGQLDELRANDNSTYNVLEVDHFSDTPGE
jgi:hypothetical protein